MQCPLRIAPALAVAMLLPLGASPTAGQSTGDYAWLAGSAPRDTLGARFAPPPGFEREPLRRDAFGAWLRGLPLLPGRPDVRLFDGRPKPRQDVHAAVLDIDVGTRDLQQCADAVIRLRAEWLFATSRRAALRFHFTSGDEVPWLRWAAGERPIVRGRHVRWARGFVPDDSYASFRRYLDTLFTYAGSLSLERETLAVAVDDMRAGDVFVQGGSPGHAVLVVDTAREAATGRRVFALAQSYMPAQQIHVLLNLQQPQLDVWYPVDFGARLLTPEWTFERRHLRRPRD